MTIPSNSTRQKGFSLLELMVVITIIGILLTILFPAGQSVLTQMRKTQAQRTATELRTAITNYYSEYKRFPALTGGGGGGDVTVETTASSGLLGKLMGGNTRGILFFSEKKAKAEGKAGLWYQGDDVANASLYDPWGQPFRVTIDSNYDNKISVPHRDGNGGTETIFKGAAVWSTGPDGEPNGKPKNDDIYAY